MREGKRQKEISNQNELIADFYRFRSWPIV
jgi:hypothetical protein